jgi:hypothetical protein
MPEVVEAAGSIALEDAAAAVLERYVRIVGAASEGDIAAMFGWSPRQVDKAAARAGLKPAEIGSHSLLTIPNLGR